jgi:predicted Zn finger-like uncharacterized protein
MLCGMDIGPNVQIGIRLKMRLHCPNCRAQYEVPDTAIPPEGRDVECSNCGHNWFQAPESAEESALVLDEDMSVQPAAQPPKPRKLDPALEDVLREEAEREARARAEESSPLESQPELGLTQPTRQRRDAGRNDPFPDVDEINSTLRSASERRGLKAKEDQHPVNKKEPTPVTQLDEISKPSRLKAGAFWGLALVVAAALIYTNASSIARDMPGLEQPLDAYSNFVDDLRFWLHDLIHNGGADDT